MSNLPASIRQKLLNASKEQQRPFMEILQRYGMERFLCRLSRSAHADKFILKGAMLLKTWSFPSTRPTMDIDLLGLTDNQAQAISVQMRDIMNTEVEEDGLEFRSDSITTQTITEDADYIGLRIKFICKLGNIRINIQVDMGFGDSIYPLPQMRNLPSLLGFAEPRLLCYPLETAIAEKFQAMIHLDEMNSRMKDFYDIWYLSRHVKFEGSVMVEAIRLTMDKRDTVMPAELTAFSEDFVKDRQSLWKIFIERMQLENIPASLSAVVDDLKHFLLPIADAIRLQQHFAMGWDGTQWNREEV